MGRQGFDGRRAGLAVAVLTGAMLAALPAMAQEARTPAGAALTPMLQSRDLVFNGIARSRDGRLFSPFQRQRKDMPFQRQRKDMGIELGEWVDGKPVPYPDAAWNAWTRGDDPATAFVGLNAIRIGPDGGLWGVDKGADGMGVAPLPGGAKLVRIDLVTNAVTKVYPLDDSIGGKSFIDDFRFHGRSVYLSDAGQPGIVVLDLDTGRTRRVLDGHPSMVSQRPLTGEGHPLADETGRPIFIHADQLEVSPDGKWFYYQPCTGPIWKIETRWLDDASVSDEERGRHVSKHADVGSTGGTAIDAAGTIYASDTDGLRILAISPKGEVSTLVQDDRLVWGDAMWIDETGGLWIPAAQMNRTPIMNGGKTDVAFPTTIFRMQIGAAPVPN